MSYKTKTQRQADAKRLNLAVTSLLANFGNFLLEKHGIEKKVTEEDLKEFNQEVINKK